MKGMLLYFRLDGYLREWLVHTFGSPVSFPARSYENAIIVRHLIKRPPGVLPLDGAGSDTVPIVIPDNGRRPPEHYNHLSIYGQRLLHHAVLNLFTIDLWHGCAPLCGSPGLNEGIYRWCDRHGIDFDHQEAVRQRFYRMRKEYRLRGIICEFPRR